MNEETRHCLRAQQEHEPEPGWYVVLVDSEFGDEATTRLEGPYHDFGTADLVRSALRNQTDFVHVYAVHFPLTKPRDPDTLRIFLMANGDIKLKRGLGTSTLQHGALLILDVDTDQLVVVKAKPPIGTRPGLVLPIPDKEDR